MSSLPTRRPTSATPPSGNNHHITNSLNRLASSNHLNQSPSLLSRIFLRGSRRIRWLILILIVLIGLFYWPQLRKRSNDWQDLLSSPRSKSNLDPDSRIPTVSRDVLDVLEELDQSQLDDEEKAIQEMIVNNSNSDPGLPRLTALPTDNHHHPSSKKPTCPDHLPSPCRFLIAGYIGEQETKAQIHLHQLALLALALNRTLVLPQVSQSRMGSCLEHSFDLYYHPDALTRLGVRTVTHEKFLHWATATSELPSARLLAILDHNQIPSTPPQGSVSYDHSNTNGDTLSFLAQDRQFCLRNNLNSNPKKSSKLNLNFNSFSPLTIVSPVRWRKSVTARDKFAKQIIDSVRRSDSINPAKKKNKNKITKRTLFTSDSDDSQSAIPDALVVNYELRYPFLDPASSTSQLLLRGSTPGDEQLSMGELKTFEHFPYASVWIELAELLLKQTPAMVGVHWRQENIQIAQLQRCATSLLLTLDSLKNSYPSLEAVYLSTDYPIEQALLDDHHQARTGGVTSDKEIRAHSGTFSKLITQDHHSMMRDLINHPVPLKWYTFNSLVDKLDISADLLDKFLQLSLFSSVKEIDRLMKVRRKSNTLDVDRGWTDWIDDHPQKKKVVEENRKELSELIKDKLRLRAGSSSGIEGEEGEGEIGEKSGKMIDIGVIGILEKLILIRSTVFLTGVPNQCSKLSSFTNQVVLHRQHLIDQNFDQFGYLTDSDYRGNPQPNLQRFNLVEFWSPSP